MSTAQQPKFIIIYNKKDITADITPFLASVSYTDATEDKSDGLQIDLTNASGIWLEGWYPTLGDTLEVSVGYDGNVFSCGLFEIDEAEWKAVPDTMCIKGVAAGVKEATRTKRSSSHENKTLKQIAQAIAANNGYQVQGDIQDTGQISRVTQFFETDLCFLNRLSKEWGHLFSVRGGVITFTNIYAVEALAAATSISRNDLAEGSSIKDKTYDTYKKAHALHFDPNSGKVIETEFSFPEVTNEDGFTYNAIVKKDTKEIRLRADNESQATMKAIAALHSSNSKQQEGVLVVKGNPLLLAGNNFELTECGYLSGIYHIVSSSHKLIPHSGYTTTIKIKRVGFVDITKIKRKKPKKQRPVHVQIVK